MTNNKTESFEDWWRPVVNSDQNPDRTQYAAEMAWNHQQKKLDEALKEKEALSEACLSTQVRLDEANKRNWQIKTALNDKIEKFKKLESDNEKYKGQIAVMREALEEIKESKDKCIMSHSEDFRNGSHTAFAQQAEIASEALEKVDKEPNIDEIVAKDPELMKKLADS